MLSQGIDVIIALPDGPFVPQLEALGCRFIATPFSRRGMNPLRELKLLHRYAQIVRQVKPDVVLTYTIKPNIYGGLVCRFRKVPYLPNITGLGASLEKGGILKRVTIKLYTAALKNAACVFFQNQENLDFMQHRKVISKQKCQLLPGSGVNTEQFSLLDYPPDGMVHFLFIGRIMAEKGIEQYLDAAAHFSAWGEQAVFHILGSCEEGYEKKLTQLQERGVIIYHGVQNDVREFHAISHCTVHPSYWEGMSNVLLESASCGRPVITSDISGCREIVSDGVTGFLCERKNSASFIDAIARFLLMDNTARARMGLEGRKKVERQFDRRRVIGAYMQEIEVAAGHAAWQKQAEVNT